MKTLVAALLASLVAVPAHGQLGGVLMRAQ